MSSPYYVAPEQVMKDRADYARKGIARGRALVAVMYDQGIVLVAENPSNTLRKVSEIYDRIAFAGVGRYNEFDQLRVAGVRAADTKGYQYSRDDVEARGLANQYAQILGQVFTHEMKPMEVEILVAEVGFEADDNRLYHILYDGTIMDEKRFSVLGGDADAITGRMNETFAEGSSLADAIRGATAALAGPERQIAITDLEVAFLARTNGRRCFQRLSDNEVEQILGVSQAEPEVEGEPAVEGEPEVETEPKAEGEPMVEGLASPPPEPSATPSKPARRKAVASRSDSAGGTSLGSADEAGSGAV
jgi:proteasome alpha subunit